MKSYLITGILLILFGSSVLLRVYLQGDEKVYAYYAFNHWFDLTWEVAIPTLLVGIILLGLYGFLPPKTPSRSKVISHHKALSHSSGFSTPYAVYSVPFYSVTSGP